MQTPSPDILFATSAIADGNMSFRIGDTAASLQHRVNFLQKHTIDFRSHIAMKCDHGEEIIVVNYDTAEVGATTQEEMLLAEVLVTQEKGLALMLLTADCLPVSFYDPITQTVALAHFSRQTIVNGLPEKTIRFLTKQFSINSANLIVHIGPHIHTSSYAFPLPQRELPSEITPFTKQTDTYICIDLVEACNAQLCKQGIPIKNISVTGIDTATSPQHFSHYQSKEEKAPQGRLATILMLSTE